MNEEQKKLADKLFPKIRRHDAELELLNVPPEKRRLHTETSDYTVSSINDYLCSGKLIIPNFQRGYVWTRVQASRLIESLLIQCPIPVIYLSQELDGQLLAIDGNQRLLSIQLFIGNAFKLQGLNTYPELNNISWSALDPRFRDHILNRTLRCITILSDTHPQIKFDVFERLNTGSTKLNAHELRHGINHSYLMEKVSTLATNQAWLKTIGRRDDRRMRGAELILRYFALRQNRTRYQKPLSAFLDDFSSRNKHSNEIQINEWAEDFQHTLERVQFSLHKYAFRAERTSKSSAFNAALYDAQMIGFAETDNPIILNARFNPEFLIEKSFSLIERKMFSDSIRRATSNEQSVYFRISEYKKFLDSYVLP
jgi:hypothetical protein